MTRHQFEQMIAKAKAGRTRAFEQYFRQLFEEICRSLQPYTPSKSEAAEAFAEVIARFWVLFVEGDRPLPKSNIEGYLFTMAKMFCLEKYRQSNKVKIVPIDKAFSEQESFSHDFYKEETEKRQQELQYEAINRAIKKVEKKCQKLIKYMLKKGIDKPAQLWEPLGYKNARTISSLKNECLKALRAKSVIELDNILKTQKENQL
jgi:DNA-directed RNA polymerase specialized sigma24 family protein